MAALTTPEIDRSFKALDFNLPGTDGKNYTLEKVMGSNGLLVMFICNHCPFVQAVLPRIVRDSNELIKSGIGVVAIMSNDTDKYPDDNFSNMQKLATAMQFPFPYLLDETQNTAREYGAVCTPDFFGFNRDLRLRYRGRLDESRMEAIPNARPELLEAMNEVADTGDFKGKQTPSIGCSIKWR